MRIEGAGENNLRDVSVDLPAGITAVVGVSGSGKSSLAFDTLYHEARRRFLETLSPGSPWLQLRPAHVRAIDGLAPAVALGQNRLNRNPNSTVATATGIHPYLRLLYARFAERRCAACGADARIASVEQMLAALRRMTRAGDGEVDVVAPLVRATEGSHARLLAWLAHRYGRDAVDVDGGPWGGQSLDPDVGHEIAVRVASMSPGADLRALRDAIEHVRSLGTPHLLLRAGSRVESMTRAPICPSCGRPFRVLRPEDFRDAATATATYRLGGHTLGDLLHLDVAAAARVVAGIDPGPEAGRAVREVRHRLDALVAIGLGYLPLDRPSPSLSRGEGQRLRIAMLLAHPLDDLLHVLDEPTIGLDATQVGDLLGQLAKLRGPVVMVEHDPAAVAAADHVVELGPGPGREGGRVVFEGVPADLWRAGTESGAWFSGRHRAAKRPARAAPRGWIAIRGATLRNLRDVDVEIPVGAFTAICGPSGAGKTTLARDVLVASLASRSAVRCRALEGPRLRPVTVTQEPIGRNPRSNAATYSGLADVIRARFASATGEVSGRFSFNRDAGACPACEGTGSVEIRLPYLPSEWLTCEACDGRRFRPEAVAATIAFPDGVARSIADVFELAVDDAARLFPEPAAQRVLGPLQQVGLGYLPLGQPSPSLSGGEAQRVKLARSLATARDGDLVLLDEPTTGLHPADLSRLIEVMHALVERGSTVVVVEHQPDVIDAADWVVRLGPGGGPDGGRLLAAGPPERGGTVAGRPVPAPRSAPRRRPRNLSEIVVTGATANNLRDVSVAIPKGALTGVVGVSGSGKSSLLRDVLEAEAMRRLLESLSMYERQSIREGPEPPARRIDGLGPTIAIGTERRPWAAATTVGTATELGFHLAVLLAFAGSRTCPACGGAQRRMGRSAGVRWNCERCGTDGLPAEPRHFSPGTYAAACLTCHGVGTVPEPRLERLVVRPDLPICRGALSSPGYYPHGYLSKPESLGYWMLQAIGERYGFDPFETPWDALTGAARQAFLWGDEPVDVPAGPSGRAAAATAMASSPPVSARSRPGSVSSPPGDGTRSLNWRGVFRIVSGWDLGGLYVDHVRCAACGGGRLRPEYLDVRLCGMNRQALHEAPLAAVERTIDAAAVPADAPEWVDRSRTVALRRLAFLRRVGLSHLHLDRPARTLSAGEAQRLRLAALLGTELAGLTVLLDEPSRGLHRREVDALGDALRDLVEAGNTIVVVDHDTALVDRADHLVVLGPGAGPEGGRLLAAGPARDVRAMPRADVHAIVEPASFGRTHLARRTPRDWMVVHGPAANNLDGRDVSIPLGVLAGVCGVSGAGKSSLAIEIVARALAPQKLTTSVAYDDIRPGAHAGIDGAPARAIHADQSRSGIHTPGAFLGIVEPLRRAFADSGSAAALGIEQGGLAPDCDACHGRGSVAESMGFLPSIQRPCDACAGTGYRAELRELRVRGTTLPDLAEASLGEVLDAWGDLDAVRRPLEVAVSVGLGYLRLGQPSRSLSGGEAQRLKLARELGRATRRPTLYILDEPTLGLHARDVARLVDVLDGLVDAGHSVLVVEHDPALLACADWLVELGPGGGPDGGHVIAEGTPETVAGGATPTAPYLRAALA